MKETIYTKPLRMPDDIPSRATDSIRVTEDECKVTSVERFNGNRFEPLEIESLSSIDPMPKLVSYTENGEYSVKPEGYDGLSEVRVTVEVPAPSGGNVLVLKSNNTPIPYNPGHWEGEEQDTYIGPTAIPFDLISSESASSINYYRCIVNETEWDSFVIQGVTSSNLPLTINYTPYDDEDDPPISLRENYIIIIVLGTDTPGASLTIDTRYFDIVEPSIGYSADFSVQTVD